MYGIEKRVDEFYKYRKADIRIVEAILSILNLSIGSKIADIGAGYGKYSVEMAKRGYYIYSLEPSVEMKKYYSDTENVKWITAYADNIPLDDCKADASVLILSIHHFSDLEKCIKEINRITKEKILILTFDPEIYTKYWLFDYIPELKNYYYDRLLNFTELYKVLEDICKREVKETIFKIPCDCCDLFSAAAWKRPEIFLDTAARKSMSPFSYIDKNYINKGLSNLKRDIDDNTFDKRYHTFLDNVEVDLGCRLLIV